MNVLAGEPHRPGPQHRAGHDRRRERRPVAEDHRRREGRDPRAEEHHQHDGRSAPLLRRRGHARREGGRYRRQARRPGRRQGVGGTWKDLTDNVNAMAANLTDQVRNIALVTTAVANGDLSQKITVDVKGEILELKNTINTMVDQLSSVRRRSHARREGSRHRRQARRSGRRAGVAGTWKDLTDNVNFMASNLTDAGARHRQGRHRGRQRRPRSRSSSSTRRARSPRSPRPSTT